MCCATTPGVIPALSLSHSLSLSRSLFLTLARKLLHALLLASFLSQSPRQSRANAAWRPASGVAIIRQGPRSGRAVAEAAEAGRQRQGCRATAARRPASGVTIIRQGQRSGRAVAEAAEAACACGVRVRRARAARTAGPPGARRGARACRGGGGGGGSAGGGRRRRGAAAAADAGPAGQRRRDYPPRAAQRKGRGGGCRSRAAEAGWRRSAGRRYKRQGRRRPCLRACATHPYVKDTSQSLKNVKDTSQSLKIALITKENPGSFLFAGSLHGCLNLTMKRP
jgi:hypothetical protein